MRRGNPNATVRADVPLSYYKILDNPLVMQPKGEDDKPTLRNKRAAGLYAPAKSASSEVLKSLSRQASTKYDSDNLSNYLTGDAIQSNSIPYAAAFQALDKKGKPLHVTYDCAKEFKGYGRYVQNGDNYADAFYFRPIKPEVKNGVQAGVQAGLVKFGSDHKYVEFEVDAVTVQAIAGLNKEYKGIKLNAHLVGGEAVTVIPIPFTDKELLLGGSVDIGSIGWYSYYDKKKGRFQLGASVMAGGSTIIGIR